MTAAHAVRLDQRPRPVADRRDRLAALHEMLHERHRLGIDAQRIRVGNAARQNQRIEPLRRNTPEIMIDRDFIALLVMVHSLDLTTLRRNDDDLGTSCLQRLHRFGQFDLLETIRGQHGDPAVGDSPHVISFPGSPPPERTLGRPVA